MKPDFSMKVLDTFIGGFDQVISVRHPSLNATIDGLAGDRHFGHWKKAGVRESKFHEKGTIIFNARQWSAVDDAELSQIALEMGVPEVRAEWLGANLLLTNPSVTEALDFSFTKLPGITRLVFDGGVVLLVYGENLPCKHPAEAMLAAQPEVFADKAKLFGKAAMGRRGLVGWVERAGIIRPNENVAIYLPK